jgi:hypothetical protein
VTKKKSFITFIPEEQQHDGDLQPGWWTLPGTYAINLFITTCIPGSGAGVNFIKLFGIIYDPSGVI